MLDAYIIDKLKREREKRNWEPVPLEIPVYDPTQYDEDGDVGDSSDQEDRDQPSDKRDDQRGIIIIETRGND